MITVLTQAELVGPKTRPTETLENGRCYKPGCYGYVSRAYYYKIKKLIFTEHLATLFIIYED